MTNRHDYDFLSRLIDGVVDEISVLAGDQFTDTLHCLPPSKVPEGYEILQRIKDCLTDALSALAGLTAPI